MKRSLILTGLLSVALITSACTTTHTNVLSSPFDVTASANELKADIKVGDKITGSSVTKTLFGVFRIEGGNKFADGVSYNKEANYFKFLGGAVEEAKASAAYNAVHDSGADVIVAPKYVVEVEDNFFTKKYTVVVTGYKGTITGIKQKL